MLATVAMAVAAIGTTMDPAITPALRLERLRKRPDRLPGATI